MRNLLRAFTDHPASVNETYGQHLRAAASFGASMVIAGLACLVHGLLPFLFKSTGSNAIRALHERMVANRASPPRGMPPRGPGAA